MEIAMWAAGITVAAIAAAVLVAVLAGLGGPDDCDAEGLTGREYAEAKARAEQDPWSWSDTWWGPN